MRKRYKVNITLSGGDEVHATVEARNGNEAVWRIKKTQQYIDFVHDHPGETITATEVEPINTPPRAGKICITNAPNRSQWYVVEHLESGIRVEFKKGEYNEKQRIWVEGEPNEADPLHYATALREIGDWMAEYFPEMI